MQQKVNTIYVVFHYIWNILPFKRDEIEGSVAYSFEKWHMERAYQSNLYAEEL